MHTDRRPNYGGLHRSKKLTAMCVKWQFASNDVTTTGLGELTRRPDGTTDVLQRCGLKKDLLDLGRISFEAQ